MVVVLTAQRAARAEGSYMAQGAVMHDGRHHPAADSVPIGAGKVAILALVPVFVPVLADIQGPHDLTGDLGPHVAGFPNGDGLFHLLFLVTLAKSAVKRFTAAHQFILLSLSCSTAPF